MQETAIQSGAPASLPGGVLDSPPALPTPTIQKAKRGFLYNALTFCASLRVTVVLFVLAFILVFYGTWAQVDASIWTVVKQYFRWWYAWIPLKTLLFRTVDIPENYAIPFPGGWTLGALLLFNLLAAHAVRFKLSWRRSGIIVLHFGLILMMLGEFYTGLFAVEGYMTIPEGYSSNFVENHRDMEIAFVAKAKPNGTEEIQVPHSFLRDGNVIKDSELPFDIEILHYMKNSNTRAPKPGETNRATAGIGLRYVADSEKEVPGVESMKRDFPAAYVTLRKKATGESVGTYLLSTFFSSFDYPPDTVLEGGKKYEIVLRPQRTYRDYSIELNKFQHKKFVGTEVAKDFRSFITLHDQGKAENRKVEIYMNHPLYYRTETFYQSSMPVLYKGTVLQVARNEAWSLPYWSCGLVAGGMLLHFGIMLVNFLEVQGIISFKRRGAVKPARSPS
jgi:ResB-like family